LFHIPMLILVRRGNVAEVKEGLKILAPRYKFKVTASWNTFLVEAHTQCGEFVTAQNILRKLSFNARELLATGGSAKVCEQLYVDLMRALVNDGRVHSACALFERMKQRGFEPSAETYEWMIALIIETHDSYQATEMLVDMRKSSMIYYIYIPVYCGSKFYPFYYYLRPHSYCLIPFAGHVPSQKIIIKLLELKIALHRTDECFELYNECQKHGPFPDISFYSTFIIGLSKMNKFDEVLQVFHEMQWQRPREVYHCALDASARLKHLFRTKKIWIKMVESIGSPNLTEQDYATYLVALVHTGDLDDALGIMDEMHNAGLPRTQHTAYAMLTIAAYSRNLEMARTQFESMRKNGYLKLSTQPWHEMIKLLVSKEDVSGARALFEEMRASGEPAPDTSIYNQILKEVPYSEMMGLYEEMKTKKVYPDQMTYIVMALRLAHKGEIATSLEVVKEMRDAGFVIPKKLMMIYPTNTPTT